MATQDNVGFEPIAIVGMGKPSIQLNYDVILTFMEAVDLLGMLHHLPSCGIC